MADANVAITAGAGTLVDTRTDPDGEHRQVVVLGDGAAASTVSVRAAGDAVVGFITAVATGTISAADAVSASTPVSPVSGITQQLITGTPTANSTVVLPLDGQGSFTLQITGTFSGVFYFERSLDGGTTWIVGPLVPYSQTFVTSMVTSGSLSQGGVFQGECAGCTHIRLRAGSFSSGSAAIRFNASPAHGFAPVSVNHQLAPIAPGTAARSNVTASVTSVTLLNGGTTRPYYSCFNDSTATLYLNNGSTASLTAFTVKIPPGGYFESAWSGSVFGIWDAANGAARMTNYSP